MSDSISPSLPIIQADPWLKPFETAITGRYNDVIDKLYKLAPSGNLSDFANAHHYFGMHRRPGGGFVFREFAPNATSITLIGDFSDWKIDEKFCCENIGDGVWELIIPKGRVHHGDFYKMHVARPGGEGERIPAYATRVVQDADTHIFAAQVDAPSRPFRFKCRNFRPKTEPLLIYECHIGMAQEEEGVGSYNDFTDKILPRIAANGYNAIQIMAIQEHPYYGSFGYHVSNFYAPSSRFGTADDLRRLIDTAHTLGIAVIMDIVHSHAVKNQAEGLALLDGNPNLYFYSEPRHTHPAWDSLLFDYGKDYVLNFLLSNCKYWLQEFHFDGFRFDGVTSMLYLDHGLGKAFSSYEDYYNGNQDTNAITYLSLANILIHQINPKAITIAEEMSGMPGIAVPVTDGGIGFDYRMAMGIPDYWIKLIKEKTDSQWSPSSIFYELTNRRSDEKTVSYCESHDQALVGDKTIMFRLADKEMYWHMMADDQDIIIDRAIALHKMIRLATLATVNGAYLTFMGNEFGHPEWIDFPRQGNDWSYKYARRQWSLLDRNDLKYQFLNNFEQSMLHVVLNQNNFRTSPVVELWHHDEDQVLVFQRNNLIFAFNWNPDKSFTDYGILTLEGEYNHILDTDDARFGGHSRLDPTVSHHTISDPLYAPTHKGWLRLYLPARTAIILHRHSSDCR